MPRGRAKGTATLGESYTDEQIRSYKWQILRMMENCEAKTVSSAARKLGISCLRAKCWLTTDSDFRQQVKQAESVLGDKILEELLEIEPGKFGTIAKIFLLKGLRPEFRDSYRVVEFKDSRAITVLEELRRLGKENPKELPEPAEPENPLSQTIERVKSAEQSSN